MEFVIEEFGQALLALLAGGAAMGLFIWVLNMATAF